MIRILNYIWIRLPAGCTQTAARPYSLRPAGLRIRSWTGLSRRRRSRMSVSQQTASEESAMRQYVAAFALLFIAGAYAADRHKLDIDPESQDGILLQRIRQEPTVPRRLALL